jgi:ribosomal protein S20
MPTEKQATKPTRTAPRTARLNRRRYSEIVRLLKEVISNEKAGLARRVKAAETLLGVYDRHDRAVERKEARRNSAEQGSVVIPSPAEVTHAEPSAEEDARAFIAKMQLRRQAVGAEEGVDNDVE